jgi:hypothetical protein
LKQAGLDGLWTVANSTAESFKALKVSGDSDHEIDQPTLDTEVDVKVSDYSGAPIRFQHQKKFDSVQFFPRCNDDELDGGRNRDDRSDTAAQ